MQIKCSRCGKTLNIPDHLVGKSVKCPCGSVLKTAAASTGTVGAPVTPSFHTQGRSMAGATTPTHASKTMSITSLVLGVSSIVFCFGFLSGIPAIITGVVAKKRIRQGTASGSGLALAGIITGSVGAILMSALVIGIAVLLPAVQAGREASRRMSCSNNLKEIALAMHNYHSAFKQLPATATGGDPNNRLLSWRVAILPFIDGQESLYEEFHHDEPWDSEHNLSLVERMPDVYRCDSAGVLGAGKTTYMLPINAMPASAQNPPLLFEKDKITRFRDTLDGLSNTIMLVEAREQDAVIWTKPDDLPVDLSDPLRVIGDTHAGGSHVLLADGAVVFITSSIDPGLLSALLTRNGGEIIE
jgi:hypothetical protein